MELGDYRAALVRGWWLIVLFGLAGLAVPLLLPTHKGHTSTYYTSASVVGSPPVDGSNGGSSLLGGGISTTQILYYARTDDVMTQTAKLSGLNESPQLVRSQISLVGPDDSGNSGPSSGLPGLVDVTASGATPAAALALNQGFVSAMNNEVGTIAKGGLEGAETQTEATLATVMNDIATNTYAPGLTAQALEVQIAALQNYLASLVVTIPATGFELVQAPSAASVAGVTIGTPTAVDNKTLRFVVGALIGMVVGALAALGLWLLDKRLKTAKRAQTALGYPVVAEIPSDASDSTEAYRMLWLSVFREPLPLPPAEQNGNWYGGEDPVLDHDTGRHAERVGRP